ncbi:GTP cyclohydrolase I [Onishia taeanensis]|uniref:GTP cyclohydrolase I n=1 Tax=Onishia taeanensis TaxID=284577 RepID=A0A1G7RVB8_9GAMM|nr:hypothetical protein [Halomonas taeanensis]SDG14678.1 GTP cyclohydrolase I [Halomonas taeanensis]
MQRQHADIADSRSQITGALSWVGMEQIALPFNIAGQPVSGYAAAGVSLDDPSTRLMHSTLIFTG